MNFKSKKKNSEPSIITTYRVRLKPLQKHKKLMYRFAYYDRFVWNYFLGLQKERLDKGEKIIRCFDAEKMLTQFKKEKTFLQKAPAQSLNKKIEALDTAIWACLKPKKGNKRGFPEFKTARDKKSFLYPSGVKLDQEKHRILLPKIGWVSYVKDREIIGTVKNVTISCDMRNWYASVQVEIPEHKVEASTVNPIGIDLGVNVFAALSEGEKLFPVNKVEKYKNLDRIEWRIIRLQRRLARKRESQKKDGRDQSSNRYRKLSWEIAKLHHKVSNIRKDFLHNTSKRITDKYNLIIIEDLNIANMVRSARGTIENPGKNVKAKSRLNRSILNQGWGMFREQLKYKSQWKGGKVVLVDPAFTSQKCSFCGHVDKENRKTQASFVCKNCGAEYNADVNAAKNILQAGLSSS